MLSLIAGCPDYNGQIEQKLTIWDVWCPLVILALQMSLLREVPLYFYAMGALFSN
jgi:hypothetical protein